jgi:hypothetical protein
MPRLKSSVVAILTSFVSLGLFIASWILVGWGAVFASAVGAVGIASGGALYFCSLHIALRSKVQALTAIVILLGAVLGLLTVLVTATNIFEPSFEHSHIYAALAISILTAETLVFVCIVRASHSHAACLYKRLTTTASHSIPGRKL